MHMGVAHQKMASKQDIADVKRVIQELRKTNFDLQLRVEVPIALMIII